METRLLTIYVAKCSCGQLGQLWSPSMVNMRYTNFPSDGLTEKALLNNFDNADLIKYDPVLSI